MERALCDEETLLTYQNTATVILCMCCASDRPGQRPPREWNESPLLVYSVLIIMRIRLNKCEHAGTARSAPTGIPQRRECNSAIDR